MKSARQAENPSPAVQTPKGRKSEDARQANGERSRSSSLAKPKRSMSVTGGAQGLSSHPPLPPPPAPVEQPSGRLIGSIPLGPPDMEFQSRPSGPQARDARVPQESTADIAEFIRQTGPAGEIPPGASAAAGGRRPSAVGSMRNGVSPVPVKNNMEARRPSTTSTLARARLMAREATADKDDSSDLIDFIRRGPPNATGSSRIPRTVAPFRTTMDSDQLNAAVGGKAVDAMLPDIRNSAAASVGTEHSVPSSTNSQSALLRKERSPRTKLHKPQPPSPSHGTFDDEPPMPRRKTRRVRDPYAIDYSDEDEDEDLFEEPSRPAARRAAPQEESLLDFLNSVPPPPQIDPVPFSLNQAQLKKKASAHSLVARFSRSGSLAQIPGFGGALVRGPTESRSLNSRAGTIGSTRGFVPIEVHIPDHVLQKNGSISGSIREGSISGDYVPSPRGSSFAVPPPAKGRVPMRKFEPRDASAVPTDRTTELAEFLRSSNPPPQMATPHRIATGGSSPQDEPANGGFSRVFSRRKKPSVALG